MENETEQTEQPEFEKRHKSLSIVVITYRESPDQLMPTLRSIDTQIGVAWEYVEVIVVNDAGIRVPEANFEMLRNFKVNYIVCAENGGALAARQTGFDAATGASQRSDFIRTGVRFSRLTLGSFSRSDERGRPPLLVLAAAPVRLGTGYAKVRLGPVAN